VPAFIISHPLLLLAMTLSMALSASSHAAPPDGVVLLHGMCRQKTCMATMAAALQKAGYIVENIGYPSRSDDVAGLAGQVIGPAMASPTLRDCPRIHFVTHSLGGILVRRYFADHPHDRLGRVVMLGPPNQGSEVVDRIGSWWLFRKINGPAGADLGTSPDSMVNQLGPVSFELGVIAGDRSINWINSAMIKGPDDGKVSVENTTVAGMKAHKVIHAAHPFLMKNREAIRLTIRFLASGGFEELP
jgi:triacylglycerol lipase